MAKKKKNMLVNMLSGANGDLSSKRFFGGIGITIMHMIAIYASIAIPESHWIGEFLITLAITDAGLLGVGVLEKPKVNLPKEDNTKTVDVVEETYDETEG